MPNSRREAGINGAWSCTRGNGGGLKPPIFRFRHMGFHMCSALAKPCCQKEFDHGPPQRPDAGSLPTEKVRKPRNRDDNEPTTANSPSRSNRAQHQASQQRLWMMPLLAAAPVVGRDGWTLVSVWSGD